MISIGFLYWLLLLLCAIFGVWPCPAGEAGVWFRRGFGVVTFILFLLLGLHEWGWPLRR